MTDKTVQEWGYLTQVSDEMKSDTGIDLDAYLLSSFHASIKRQGLKAYGEPTIEWADLDAPENAGLRLSLTFYDEETGRTIEPMRWQVRVLGKVI